VGDIHHLRPGTFGDKLGEAWVEVGVGQNHLYPLGTHAFDQLVQVLGRRGQPSALLPRHEYSDGLHRWKSDVHPSLLFMRQAASVFRN
jgi:hypothetical protein